MTALANLAQPDVELVGGDVLAEVLVGDVDGLPDAMDGFARERTGGHNGGIAHERHAVGDLLANLGLGVGTLHQVPLVQHDDHGALAVGGEARHALVLVGQADGAVDDQDGHVGTVDGAHGAHEAVVLHVLVDLALLAQAGGVDDGVALTVVLDDGVDGVARGAGDVGHDGAVIRGQTVGQRGLASVGATDDGDVDAAVLLLVVGGLDLLQVLHHGVEQVARAVAVQRGDRPRIAQAQLVELPDLVHGIGVVHFVHHQIHRLGGLAQHARHLLVVGVDAGAAVDDEHDDVCLVHAGERLRADGALERVVVAHLDTAGVDELELNAVPVGDVVRTVAGDAAHLVHDGLVGLGNAVNEGGLADVRPSNNRHNGQSHIKSFSVEENTTFAAPLFARQFDEFRQEPSRVTAYHAHGHARRLPHILQRCVIERDAVVVEDDLGDHVRPTRMLGRVGADGLGDVAAAQQPRDVDVPAEEAVLHEQRLHHPGKRAA